MLHRAQIGPFPCVILLRSPEGVRPWSAQVSLSYQTLRSPRHIAGFPVLPTMQHLVHAEILRLTGGSFPARSGGEAASILFESLQRYCPEELARWDGCYALNRVELGLVEETGRGPGMVWYISEVAGSHELVPLPHGQQGAAQRGTGLWLAAREAAYVAPPDYELKIRGGSLEVRARADDRPEAVRRVALPGSGQPELDSPTMGRAMGPVEPDSSLTMIPFPGQSRTVAP